MTPNEYFFFSQMVGKGLKQAQQTVLEKIQNDVRFIESPSRMKLVLGFSSLYFMLLNEEMLDFLSEYQLSEYEIRTCQSFEYVD